MPIEIRKIIKIVEDIGVRKYGNLCFRVVENENSKDGIPAVGSIKTSKSRIGSEEPIVLGESL